MLSITYNSKKLYINIALLKQRIKKAFLKALIILFVISPLMYISVDLCRYPEKYVNTWKYQLYNDIQSGNEKAIDYYNSVYTSNGIRLFNR